MVRRLRNGRHAGTLGAWLMTSTSVLALACAQPAIAQGQPGSTAPSPGAPSDVARTFSFNIPPQPLPQAITALSAVTGVQVLYTDASAYRRQAPALKGSYTTAQALGLLLAGSGLTYHYTSSNAVTLEKLPAGGGVDSAINLPAVRVEGQTVGGSLYPSDPFAGMVNPPTGIGSKEPLTQREIPQSVTVVTQDQIQQQNMRTLNDAMRYAPGVSVAQDDSERTSFYSRGFQISSWMLDGLPTTQNVTSIAPNLAMFDRVEVLRGPDGIMNGFGSEGGAVDLVRKRAPSAFTNSFEVSGGTYNTFSGTADVGGPLNSSGTIRGRLVGNLQTQDLTQDTTWRHDKLIYGTLEADLTPSTKLRVGGSFSDTDQKAMWTGVPAYSNYNFLNVSRSTYLGASWNHNSYYDTTAFAELDQELAYGWSGKLAFNYLDGRSSILNGNVAGPIDPLTNDGIQQATKWRFNDQQESVDLFVNGPVPLFGRTHHLTFGATYERETLHQVNNYCTTANLFCSETASIFAPIPEPDFTGPVYDRGTVINQYGLYANARISLADPLTLVVGARGLWWNSALTIDPTANPFGAADNDNHIDGKITPYVGLIYDINKTYSAYASYTTIFQPQTATDATGNLLKPLEGEQYEVGIKGEYFGGKLDTGLALFQLTEDNRAMDDPRFPGEGFSVAAGQARSRGVELTVTGQVAPNWVVYGGYTYTDTQYLDNSTNPNGIGFSSIAPKHLLKLWTNYQLPGNFDKFSVGGGTYVSSGISATDGIGTLRQGGFATVDLRFGYKINDKMSAALNVTNLFDRHYYNSIEFTGNSFYGAPRQILFTLRASL